MKLVCCWLVCWFLVLVGWCVFSIDVCVFLLLGPQCSLCLCHVLGVHTMICDGR